MPQKSPQHYLFLLYEKQKKSYSKQTKIIYLNATRYCHSNLPPTSQWSLCWFSLSSSARPWFKKQSKGPAGMTDRSAFPTCATDSRCPVARRPVTIVMGPSSRSSGTSSSRKIFAQTPILWKYAGVGKGLPKGKTDVMVTIMDWQMVAGRHVTFVDNQH